MSSPSLVEDEDVPEEEEEDDSEKAAVSMSAWPKGM
jgi:hypothetical protein